jgi:YD repeat-containing protein
MSQKSHYTPPAVDGNGTGAVQTAWDQDRAVFSVTPSGMSAIMPHYETTGGRLTSVDFSARTNYFGYNGSTGQLASITAPDGALGYTWDGLLLTSQTWSGGLVTGTVSRTAYDTNFWLKTETYGGQTVNYSYDNDGLLTAAGGLVIARDSASGFVTGTTLGSVTDTHAYNSYGEEQTYTASYGGTQLYSADYGTRDGLGRIATKTETVQGVTHVYGYTYDGQGRLTDVTTDGSATSHYGYDANGNRLVAPNTAGTPTYDAQDRVWS